MGFFAFHHVSYSSIKLCYLQIGGGNLSNKSKAVHFLASICDGLIFVGNMAFQIMHALGWPVSVKFVEHGADEEALRIIHLAKLRSIPILCPKDFWCMTENLKEQLEIFPAHSIPEGKIQLYFLKKNILTIFFSFNAWTLSTIKFL